jgi:hypothetical protein
MKNFKYKLSLLTFLIFLLPLPDSNATGRFEIETIKFLKKEIKARADKVLFERGRSVQTFPPGGKMKGGITYKKK